MYNPELDTLLNRVYQKHLPDTSGEVAQYIPELAKVEPDSFGIALLTVKKDLIAFGDTDKKFTIQSVSKPFVFGMALELYGADKVYQHVGVEPSGESFNSIELHPVSKLPYNPMVNAGAIAVTGLIYDKYGTAGEEVILEQFSTLSGSTLEINWEVYESEWKTAHRNRALAHLMRGAGVLKGDLDEVVSLYIKQCSIEVTAKELAVMSASLANLGTNPFSRNVVFSPLTVRHVLSVMLTCGMYDFAGRWSVDIGLPAKSGVSGGVIAAVNRQAGIGIFSPRLDEIGNSVRAIASCIELAEELGLHVFEFTNKGSSLLDLYI